MERLVFSDSQKDIYIYCPLEKESGGGLWGFYYLGRIFYMSKTKWLNTAMALLIFSLLLLQS